MLTEFLHGDGLIVLGLMGGLDQAGLAASAPRRDGRRSAQRQMIRCATEIRLLLA